jgi:anti-sigma factor RsiW
MSCDSPLSWERLVDWWAGELDETGASRIEEHLLGCEGCTAVADRVAATAETLRTMVPPVLRPERLQRLARTGLRIVENPVEPGETSDFHFPKDAELAVHVLGGLSFEPGARVEVTLRSIASGGVLGHVDDAPFDAARGVVYLACQRDYAQMDHDLVAEVRVGTGRPPVRYTILHHF